MFTYVCCRVSLHVFVSVCVCISVCYVCVHVCLVESALGEVIVANKISKMQFVSVLADLTLAMNSEDFKAFTDFLTASIQARPGKALSSWMRKSNITIIVNSPFFIPFSCLTKRNRGDSFELNYCRPLKRLGRESLSTLTQSLRQQELQCNR